MIEVASDALRDETRKLLDPVAAGESITITVDGRPVAQLVPVPHRPQWMQRSRFVSDVLAGAGRSSTRR